MEPEWNNNLDQDDVKMLGLRPSFNIYLSLEKPIDCGKLCNSLNTMIQKYVSEYKDLTNRILIIEIKESNTHIPKLELQDNQI
jgi:hypothetical protein